MITVILTFGNDAEPNGWQAALNPSVGVAKGVGAFSDRLTGANTESKTRLRLLVKPSDCAMLQLLLGFKEPFLGIPLEGYRLARGAETLKAVVNIAG